MTWELKSTYSLAMIPETWLPTFTVVTAESVPAAVTVATTSPRSIFSFRNFGPELPRRARSVAPAMPAPTTTSPINQPDFDIRLLSDACASTSLGRLVMKKVDRAEIRT